MPGTEIRPTRVDISDAAVDELAAPPEYLEASNKLVGAQERLAFLIESRR